MPLGRCQNRRDQIRKTFSHTGSRFDHQVFFGRDRIPHSLSHEDLLTAAFIGTQPPRNASLRSQNIL